MSFAPSDRPVGCALPLSPTVPVPRHRCMLVIAQGSAAERTREHGQRGCTANGTQQQAAHPPERAGAAKTATLVHDQREETHRFRAVLSSDSTENTRWFTVHCAITRARVSASALREQRRLGVHRGHRCFESSLKRAANGINSVDEGRRLDAKAERQKKARAKQRARQEKKKAGASKVARSCDGGSQGQGRSRTMREDWRASQAGYCLLASCCFCCGF